MFSTGAGAEARRILGTVVVGGMLASTCIAIFLVPVTFSSVEWLMHRFRKEGPHHLDESHLPEHVRREEID